MTMNKMDQFGLFSADPDSGFGRDLADYSRLLEQETAAIIQKQGHAPSETISKRGGPFFRRGDKFCVVGCDFFQKRCDAFVGKTTEEERFHFKIR